MGLLVVAWLSLGGTGCASYASDAGDGEQAGEQSAQSTSCTELDLYMAPATSGGNDSHTGLSSAQAVETLARVQQIIKAKDPLCPTVVKVGLGTYSRQSVQWDYVPHSDITFEPIDGWASKTRPVFDGCPGGSNCSSNKLTWFQLLTSTGASTKLHFRYLKVIRYWLAIELGGNRDVAAASVRDNSIYGMWFQYIGNGWAGSADAAGSPAAVDFVNVDNTAVENSHFYDITNKAGQGGMLHGVYIAHSSDNNLVARNVFENIAGDPIRVRDYSFNNVIDSNRFTKTGSAAYSEWFCDDANRSDCTKHDECWSWENTFSNNTLDGNASCGGLTTFRYEQTNVPAHCTRPPRGAVRLHTFGNTSTGTPCSL